MLTIISTFTQHSITQLFSTLSLSLILNLYFQIPSLSQNPTLLFTNAETEVSETLRSVSLDYKIYVDAGKEDCYFQYVFPNTVLYIDYQVIKGGDGQIGFSIRTPSGIYLLGPEWKTGSNYHNENVQEGGYYSFCLDNQFSKFTAKLVSFYLTNYNADSWARYADELEGLELSVGNSTSSLMEVDSRVTQILKYLQMSRITEARDYALLQNNNYYVSFFSSIQCAIIIVAGIVHVTILKSLFNERDGAKKSSGNFKVRL